MIILQYEKKQHNKIIKAASIALRHGKVVAFPTDTSYGLAGNASSASAVKKIYQIKGRNFNKPIHIIPSNKKQIESWVKISPEIKKLTKAFWPGAFTLVLPLVSKLASAKLLSVGSGWMGVRIPNFTIAQDLAVMLKQPITATSANVSGQNDCYSGDDVIRQYQNRKLKPDILIYVKKLPNRKPSTVVKFDKGMMTILRIGPVSARQIKQVIR